MDPPSAHQSSPQQAPHFPPTTTLLPAPSLLLQLPTPMLQHIAALCHKGDLRRLRATCSTLRELQPKAIRLDCRLEEDQEGRLHATWHQDLSLSRALAAKWPGALAATVDLPQHHTADGLFDVDGEGAWHAMDEAAAQLVHWRQLRDVTLRNLASEKLVATVVASCPCLHTLELHTEVGAIAQPAPADTHTPATQLHLALQHLTRCSSLRTLSLELLHSSAWDPKCETALGQLTQLHVLELRTDEMLPLRLDAALLSSSFSRLSGLTRLLIWCGVAAGEWRIGPLPRLEALDLASFGGGTAPLAAIHDCPRLSHVSLQCARFSPLVPALLPSLQRLDLHHALLMRAEVAWVVASCPHLTSLRADRLHYEGPAGNGRLPQLRELRVEELSCRQVLLADLMPRLTCLQALNVVRSLEVPEDVPPTFLREHPSLALLSLKHSELEDEAAAWAVLSCPRLTLLEARALHVPLGFTAASACTALRQLHLRELRCPVPLADLAPQLTWLNVLDILQVPASFLHAHAASSLRVSTWMPWEGAEPGVAAAPPMPAAMRPAAPPIAVAVETVDSAVTAPVAVDFTATAPEAVDSAATAPEAVDSAATAPAEPTATAPVAGEVASAPHHGAAAGTGGAAAAAAAAAAAKAAKAAAAGAAGEVAIASPAAAAGTWVGAPPASAVHLTVELLLPGEAWGSQASSSGLVALQSMLPPAWLRGCGGRITHLCIAGLESGTAAAQVMRLLPWLPAVQVLRWGGLSGVFLGTADCRSDGCFSTYVWAAKQEAHESEATALVALAPALVRAMQQLRVVELRWLWDVLGEGTLGGVPHLTAWLQAMSSSSSLRKVRIHVRAGQHAAAVADAVRQQAALTGFSLPFQVELVM